MLHARGGLIRAFGGYRCDNLLFSDYPEREIKVMPMKNKLFVLATILAFASLGYPVIAQSNRYAVATYDSRNRMFRLSNLAGDVSDCEGPLSPTGVITSVQYDGDLPVGFTLKMKNGRRKNVYMGNVNYSNADRSNLYMLIAEGNRVQVTAYVCGNGGIWMAERIVSL
jgi:hypothetical protein